MTGLVSSKRRWQRPGNSLGDAEIERDRLGVADMEIAVRLRREPGHDLLVFGLIEVGLDDVTNEIAPNLSRHRFCHYENPVGKSAALLPNSGR
ncbi:hypothetical protein ACVWWR_007562 [Bradyrhizobium sp. LM3.2]